MWQTLTPLQWLILGLIPPLIVLLYFLKLRRTPLQVPSTYLWTRTVEDMHVNSIWQKLRRSLLLFLQLLAVGLLMLACLRLGCQGEALEGERFIFLVDQSSSMSAIDTPDKQTRLDVAKNEIKTLIDRMPAGAAAMLISFSDRAVVQQSYTVNKSLLKRKVDAIAQSQRATDISEALQAAAGLANPGRTSDRESKIDVQVAEGLSAMMHIFSDGGVKKIPGFSLGNLTPEYHAIGSVDPPVNVGITAFSINDQLDHGDQIQVFARLQNSGLNDTSVDVSLYVDNRLFDAKANVNVAALGSTNLNFDLTSLIGTVDNAIPIRLKIETEDIYLQDNEAFSVLNPARLANVLVVSDQPRYFRIAMATDRVGKIAKVQIEDRAFLDDKTFQEQSALGFYDLIIFDQCVPQTMPTANTVFWGTVPNLSEWSSGKKVDVSPVIDVDATHPLMQSVQLGSVTILSSHVIEGPPGSISLVDSVEGSIMMLGPRGGFQDLVIGFSLIGSDENGSVSINSDWSRRLGFPVFMQNLLVYLGGTSRFSTSANHRPGDLVSFRSRLPYPSVEVALPNKKKIKLSSRSDNSFVLSSTNDSGIYEVREASSDQIDQLLAVNLLDRRESDLTVRDEMELGYIKVDGTRTSAPARKEFWPWIVLLALLVVMVEWYIYNRRVLI